MPRSGCSALREMKLHQKKKLNLKVSLAVFFSFIQPQTLIKITAKFINLNPGTQVDNKESKQA